MEPCIGQWDLGNSYRYGNKVLYINPRFTLSCFGDYECQMKCHKLEEATFVLFDRNPSGEILDYTINEKYLVTTLDTKIFRVIYFSS